jgi:hypothetical protein
MKDLEKEILSIRTKLLQGQSIESIKKEHPEMAKKEEFFKMITRKEIDSELLTALIVLLQGIENKEFTEHDASVMFGELLVEKFVKGKIKQ